MPCLRLSGSDGRRGRFTKLHRCSSPKNRQLAGQGGACVADRLRVVSPKYHHGGAGRLQAASRSILVAIRARQAVFAGPVAKSFT